MPIDPNYVGFGVAGLALGVVATAAIVDASPIRLEFPPLRVEVVHLNKSECKNPGLAVQAITTNAKGVTRKSQVYLLDNQVEADSLKKSIWKNEQGEETTFQTFRTCDQE